MFTSTHLTGDEKKEKPVVSFGDTLANCFILNYYFSLNSKPSEVDSTFPAPIITALDYFVFVIERVNALYHIIPQQKGIPMKSKNMDLQLMKRIYIC